MTRPSEEVEPFQLVGGHIAVDFANTLDNRFHEGNGLELLTSYDRLLAFCEQSGIIAEKDAGRLRRDTTPRDAARALERAIALREALFALFSAAVHHADAAPGSLDILNAALAESRAGRRLAREHGHLVWCTEDLAHRPTSLLWPIAEAAAELLTSPEVAQLRECESQTCRWLFLDRSRNHSRRWCAMKTCGNRLKARRFHARHRSSGGRSA